VSLSSVDDSFDFGCLFTGSGEACNEASHFVIAAECRDDVNRQSAVRSAGIQLAPTEKQLLYLYSALNRSLNIIGHAIFQKQLSAAI
jgi:hypothetical protein